jgi:hypothetical protein
MRAIRLLSAIAILALCAAALAWAWSQTQVPHEAGAYSIRVIGPAGSIYDGTVEALGNPLAVLLEAGAKGNFTVEVRSYGIFGNRECDGHYVESVAGHRSHGASGWVYRIHRAATGAWESPAESAACPALAPGDAVEWNWTEASAV